MRDSLAVALAGQVERVLGIVTALVLRAGLDPARMGVYTGLRLYLDSTNRTSLGIGLGAVQEIPLLRAAGRHDEARRLADLAHTTNAITCLAYAAFLVGWACLSARWADPADPLDAEWRLGLIAVAGLALIKRYETFLVAVLRAHGEFPLTAELDVVEAIATALAVAVGLWLAGFWGLLAAVGVLLLAKVAYAHARHPLRFRYAWDGPVAWRLMKVGLPILANTTVFGALQQVDRALLLWRLPDGARAAGLYSVALLGTGWSLDLAGRIALVAYNTFQTTLGRTGDAAEVARQALRATELQAPPLLAISAGAYVVGPALLGWVLPRYAGGLPALRPLMMGMVLLGLAWPARQVLIATGRPYRLCLATALGLAATLAAGLVGIDRGGIAGVAWGMTFGYACVFLATSAAAAVPTLGLLAWSGHLARLVGWLALFAALAGLAAHGSMGRLEGARAETMRGLFAAALLAPPLLLWAARHEWGGILDGRLGRR